MRTRTHNYYDARTHKPVYSFQVIHKGVWSNVAENGKPLLFKTTEERDAKRAEYRRQKPKVVAP